MLRDCYFADRKRPDILAFGLREVEEDCNFEEFEYSDSHRIIFSGSLEKFTDRDGFFYSSANIRIVRMEWLRARNIVFRPYVVAEDLDFTARCFLSEGTVIETDAIVYLYRRRKTSTTMRRDKNLIRRIIESSIRLEQDIKPLRENASGRGRFIDAALNNMWLNSYKRIVEAGFSLSDCVKITSELKKTDISPKFNSKDWTDRLMQRLMGNAFLLFVGSIVYKYVWLPWIKPIVVRN